MDFSLVLASLEHPVVTALAAFLDGYWAMCLIVAFVAAMFFTKKRLALAIALLLALALLPGIRAFYDLPRPCSSDKAACVAEPGFPSVHAATAFIFVANAVGTPLFFVFLPLGLFTAFSRVYLGVHTFEQVAGGIAFGVILFIAVDVVLKKALPLLRKETGLT